MPLRTWDCLNRNCKKRFNSTEEYPPCPRCRGARVKWVPVSFAIQTQAKKIDTNLRGLADDYGMTDIKSTREGESQRGYTPPKGVPTIPYAPGTDWAANIPVDKNGTPIVSCVPAKAPPTKIKGVGGAPRYASGERLSGPTPQFEARHNPTKGAAA